MTKEELVTLLKNYKENVSKLQLRKKEKRMYERILKDEPEIETSISSHNEINADIRSKNKISDKVGNAVVNALVKIEENKNEAKEKLVELNKEIDYLENQTEEAEIRLNSLYYKERKILTAYYVENRTAEDISQNLYFSMFSRTCSVRYIRNIIKESTEKILKL